MPHSTRSSMISTPCSASHPGIGVRRPVASTTSRRAVTSPSSTPTPRARGPVAVGSTSRPAARRPPSIRISGRRSTARRSTDSNVVRRAATATRSSSPGCPTPAGTVEGRVAASASSGHPASRRSSSTSGASAARTARHRARNVCEWPACGVARRGMRRAGSPSGSAATAVVHPAPTARSASSTRTSTPLRASARAVTSPATLPPTTTTSASAPVSPPGPPSTGSPVTRAPTRRGGRRRGGGRAGCTCRNGGPRARRPRRPGRSPCPARSP